MNSIKCVGKIDFFNSAHLFDRVEPFALHFGWLTRHDPLLSVFYFSLLGWSAEKSSSLFSLYSNYSCCCRLNISHPSTMHTHTLEPEAPSRSVRHLVALLESLWAHISRLNVNRRWKRILLHAKKKQCSCCFWCIFTCADGMSVEKKATTNLRQTNKLQI